MDASSAENVEMVRLLLDHGANPNLPHPVSILHTHPVDLSRLYSFV